MAKSGRSDSREVDWKGAGLKRDPAEWMSDELTDPGERNEPEESEGGEEIIFREENADFPQSALDMLRADHDRISRLFAQYQDSEDGLPSDASTLSEQVIAELELHSRIEQEVFYPSVEAEADADTQDFLMQSEEDHETLSRLISQLRALPAGAPDHHGIFVQLIETMQEHIEQEESMLFPVAEELLGDSLVELGDEMRRLKEELIATGQSQFPLGPE
jgi:hemerythrin-like domain-containing protein